MRKTVAAADRKRRPGSPAMPENAIPEKAPDRLAVLARIEQLEREGRFDVDAEEDPPTLPLEPDDSLSAGQNHKSDPVCRWLSPSGYNSK